MRERLKEVMCLVWRVWYPLMIYSLTGLGTAAMMQAAGFFPYGRDAVLNTAAAAVITMIPLGILYRRTRRGAENRNFDIRAGVWTVIAGIGGCFFVNNMIILTGLTSEAYAKARTLLYEPPFGMQAAAVGILIPAVEELIFRGLGYYRMRRKLSFFGAAFISAIYFGWYHGNIVQGVYAFCIGLLLAGVYEVYNSLLAPVCLHAAANMSSVLFTRLVSEEIRVRIPLIPVILVSGGVLMVSIYNIREDVKKREVIVSNDSLL